MKIFGIGLNKTGTRSLAVALRRLGFRTLHKGDAGTSALVDRAVAESRSMLTHIGEQFDAYLDVDAIVKGYARLDREYPGSRFILTTRDLDGWLRSREKHARANQRRRADGRYAGSFLDVDHAAWTAEREAHHDAVLRHFGGRDDLLVLDIVGGDGWELLAPFLGRDMPDEPFPWENRDGAGTYYGRSPLRLARRVQDRLRR